MEEKRLIDAMQTVTKMSGRIAPLIQMGANPIQVYNEVLQVVADAPTVDAVEVVRCKYCIRYIDCSKHSRGFCQFDNIRKPRNHFCSYGERKDGDGDG